MSAVAAARGLIGTRFRLHGRSAEGVDCVGLAALALRIDAPSGYALRSGGAARAIAAIEAAGLVAGTGAPGELVLLRVHAGQLHLGIASDDGLIHADAMLRRVVERPGPLPWPVIGRWRVED
jgi:lipoprotein Spr